jgi:hypothetical protein
MMDSANLPSQADLNSLYGAWNPMSYMQGQQNQDLASQFRDQAYKSNQNEVTQGALKNAQAVQMNPLLLAQQGLTNTGLDLGNNSKSISNASAGIDLSHKAALAPDSLDAQREELRTRLGDAQYNTLSNTILRSHLDNIKSGDPEKIAQTEPMLAFLNGSAGKNVAERTNTRGISELTNSARLLENQATNRNQLEIAGINAGSRIEVGAGHNAASIQAAQIKQSLNQKLAQLETMDQSNPEVARAIAQTRQDLATANAAYSNAIDLPGLQKGTLGRQGDRPPPGTAANPIVLK